MLQAAARAVKRGEQSRGVEFEGAARAHGAAARHRRFGQGGACREEAEVDRPSAL